MYHLLRGDIRAKTLINNAPFTAADFCFRFVDELQLTAWSTLVDSDKNIIIQL